MRYYYRHILTIVMCILMSLTASAQNAFRPNAWLKSDTYAYVERDSTLYLDVYRPETPRADKAAVISLFGGGFFAGARDNRQMKDVARVLTERGFTVISIDYRLGFRDKEMVAQNRSVFKLTGLFNWCIDIAVEDCAAAISWVCANSGMLDIDPDRIILTGNSAGAVTVLQLDYYRANSQPEVSALPSGWKPAAVVPYSGGIMCRKRELKYASDPAPTMLMHGTKDKIVNYKSFGLPLSTKMFGAKKVDKAMDRQDIPHWIIRFDGNGHEVASWLPGSVDLFCLFVDYTLSDRITTVDATMNDSFLKPNRWTGMSLFELYSGRR
ncbi:MAG: alpha/beta hydrolase [Bacteroidaceae bacterium]|nr:alpha/beta hydrolase [Bacteroidaceae bacterium]